MNITDKDLIKILGCIREIRHFEDRGWQRFSAYNEAEKYENSLCDKLDLLSEEFDISEKQAVIEGLERKLIIFNKPSVEEVRDFLKSKITDEFKYKKEIKKGNDFGYVRYIEIDGVKYNTLDNLDINLLDYNAFIETTIGDIMNFNSRVFDFVV